MPYLTDLVTHLWAYKDLAFGGRDELFEEPIRRGDRPPVFTRRSASWNIVAAGLAEAQRHELHVAIPAEKRHRWFRSMKSSQALTQSVFGTLKVLRRGAALAGLRAVDDDVFPFEQGLQGEANIELEVNATHMGESRPTSMDVRFHGMRRVAVECKLAESDVGNCSRPRLGQEDSQYCNGNYCVQHGRETRCALTKNGVLYWELIPQLFDIDALMDHRPCPIRHTYQIVRNVLAACTEAAGFPWMVVLLYDKRNPAFQSGGSGDTAFNGVRAALRDRTALQRCAWQDLVDTLSADQELAELTDHVTRKYGF